MPPGFPFSYQYGSEPIKMTNRWSNACQGMIENVRASIVSEGCMYTMSGLEGPDMATAVGRLLDDKTFHFGKANLVSGFQTRTDYICLTIAQCSGCHE